MLNTFPYLLAAAALLAACGTSDNHNVPPPSVDAAATSATMNQPSAQQPAGEADFYALTVDTLDGKPADLSQYRGKVALVVNVASECGYTPQYAGLEALYRECKDRGVVVLGFPSNDFGGQEPGTPEQIREFCSSKYEVDFPLFAKVQTKAGPGQSPVYALLGKGAGGQLPSWNFCKYVIGKDGKVRQFFASKTTPSSPELRAAIDAALQ